jgi:hypothetical protein
MTMLLVGTLEKLLLTLMVGNADFLSLPRKPFPEWTRLGGPIPGQWAAKKFPYNARKRHKKVAQQF